MRKRGIGQWQRHRTGGCGGSTNGDNIEEAATSFLEVSNRVHITGSDRICGYLLCRAASEVAIAYSGGIEKPHPVVWFCEWFIWSSIPIFCITYLFNVTSTLSPSDWSWCMTSCIIAESCSCSAILASQKFGTRPSPLAHLIAKRTIYQIICSSQWHC
jgi:hypothetical protein